MLRTRPDEVHIVLFQDFREAGILGKEPVSRMDGLGAGDFACGEQCWDIEIAVLGGGWADADTFVGKPHMHRIRVSRRMNGNGRDAEFLAGAQNAERDLSPVRDEDFVEHRALSRANSEWRIANRKRKSWQLALFATDYSYRVHSMIINGSPYSTG